jgi:uncharacterized protein YfaS (alpha-2-macroglobulin family)
VFTERGVYRPGEKIFYKGTVREYAGGKILPPAGNRVTFEVKNPKGEQVFTDASNLSEFGTAAGEIKVEPQWPLGTYTLTLKFGGPAVKKGDQKGEANEEEGETGEEDDLQTIRERRYTTECTFQVQEFKPPRHFAEVAFKRFTRNVKGPDQKEVPREFVRVKISGSYYAGGPVKNGQVRWKIYHTRTSYQVPGQNEFSFGCAGEEKGEMLEGGQAVLDQKGEVSLEFPLDRQVLSGRNGLLVIATVVDFDGQPATATKSFQVEPPGTGQGPPEPGPAAAVGPARRQAAPGGRHPGGDHGPALGVRGQVERAGQRLLAGPGGLAPQPRHGPETGKG